MIKFFVSSTFRDMQAERDAIQLKLYPRLKRRLMEYGQELDFCDLRWGINTKDKGREEEKMQHILEVCFKEIKECHPHFIVLLGDCYGSVPSSDIIPEVLEKMNAQNEYGKEFTREDIEGKSYTALEIEYGPFADRETFENTLFLFRKPIKDAPSKFYAESESERAKMYQLKNSIITHSWGAKTFEYELTLDENGDFLGIDELIDLVENKLFDMMKAKLDELKSMQKWEMDRLKSLSEAKKRARCFYSPLLLEESKALLREEVGTLSICGPSGAGKSCLASKLIIDKANEGWNAYPIFLSSTEREYPKENIFAKWAFYIRNLLNMPQPQGDSEECTYLCYDDFRSLLYKYSKRMSTPLLLSLDCINYLETNSVFLETNSVFVEEKIPNVYFLTVIRLDRNLTENESHHKYIYVNYLENDKKNILDGQLRAIGKSLPNDIKTEILSTHMDKPPAYFGLLIQRLIMIDGEDLSREYYDENGRRLEGIDQITQLQKSIIKESPKKIEELAWELINEMTQRLNNKLIYDAVAYIAISPDGIKRRDLERLFKNDNKKWDNLAFSLFIWNLDCIFTDTGNGLIRIENEKIRDYILSKINASGYLKGLIDYIMLGDDTRHLYPDFIVHCSKVDNVGALLEMIKHKPYFLNEASIKRLFSNKDAYSWFIDCYLGSKVEEKKNLHKLIASFRGNRVFGYKSSYERLYTADVQALEELFELGENVKSELGEAYSSLADFTYGEKAIEYHKKALDYMNGEDKEYIGSIIASHLDISRRVLYSNLPSAIKSINEATRLVYANKDSISAFSRINFLYTIYDRKLDILREISNADSSPVATMRDDTDEILLDAYMSFLDTSKWLEHPVSSSLKSELLRNVIYYIKRAVLDKDKYLALCNDSIRALKEIYDKCERRYKTETVIILFRIVSAFIEGLDSIGQQEFAFELCYEADRAFEEITNQMPNTMLTEMCENVITIADIYNKNGEYSSACLLCARAEAVLPRVEHSYTLYMDLLGIRAKINVARAQSYYYMNEDELACECVLNAIDYLALMSSNAKVGYMDTVLEYTTLLSRAISLYYESVKGFNDYRYMDSFVHITGVCTMIINQSWEAFIEAPFFQMAEEVIYPLMYSYLAYLDKFSKLTCDASADIWYMAISDAYSAILTRKSIVRFMGTPSGLLFLTRGAYSFACLSISKGEHCVDNAISLLEDFKKELAEIVDKRYANAQRTVLLALLELYNKKGKTKKGKKAIKAYYKKIPVIKTQNGISINLDEYFYYFNLEDGTVKKYSEEGCIESFYEFLAAIRGKLLIANEAKKYKAGFDRAMASKSKEMDSMALFVSVLDKSIVEGVFDNYSNLILGIEFAMLNATKQTEQSERDKFINMALCVLKSPVFDESIESQNVKLSTLLALRHIDVSNGIKTEIMDTSRALLATLYEKTGNKQYTKISAKLK